MAFRRLYIFWGIMFSFGFLFSQEQIPVVRDSLAGMYEENDPFAEDVQERTPDNSQFENSTYNLPITITGLEAYSPERILSWEPDSNAFGIIIGNYTTQEILHQQIKKFVNLWRGEIWAYQVNIRGSVYFRLVLGTYKNAREAKIYADIIHDYEKINAQVIDLRYLLE